MTKELAGSLVKWQEAKQSVAVKHLDLSDVEVMPAAFLRLITVQLRKNTRAASVTIKGYEGFTTKHAFAINGHVSKFAILANGELISSHSDNTVRIWDIDAGVCTCTCTFSDCQCSYLAALSNGMIAIGLDKNVRILDPKSKSCVYTLTHDYPVTHLAALSNGRLVCGYRINTAAYGNSSSFAMRVWDVNSGNRLADFALNSGYYLSELIVLPGDRLGVVDCYPSSPTSYTMHIWDMSVGKEVAAFGLGSNFSSTFAILPDEKLAIKLSDSIQIWDIHSKRCTCTITDRKEIIAQVAVLGAFSDGKLVGGCGYYGTVAVWDVASNSCVHVSNPYGVDEAGGAQFFVLPHNKLVFTGASNGRYSIDILERTNVTVDLSFRKALQHKVAHIERRPDAVVLCLPAIDTAELLALSVVLHDCRKFISYVIASSDFHMVIDDKQNTLTFTGTPELIAQVNELLDALATPPPTLELPFFARGSSAVSTEVMRPLPQDSTKSADEEHKEGAASASTAKEEKPRPAAP